MFSEEYPRGHCSPTSQKRRPVGRHKWVCPSYSERREPAKTPYQSARCCHRRATFGHNIRLDTNELQRIAQLRIAPNAGTGGRHSAEARDVVLVDVNPNMDRFRIGTRILSGPVPERVPTYSPSRRLTLRTTPSRRPVRGRGRARSRSLAPGPRPSPPRLGPPPCPVPRRRPATRNPRLGPLPTDAERRLAPNVCWISSSWAIVSLAEAGGSLGSDPVPWKVWPGPPRPWPRGRQFLRTRQRLRASPAGGGAPCRLAS